MCRLLTLLLLVVAQTATAQDEKIKGITMVAPPQEWQVPPIEGLEQLNTEWVGIVPYGFIEPGDAKVQYDLPWQWWGERRSGVATSVDMAHSNGMKVMLKPQVYIPGGWVGDLDYHTDEEWIAWQTSYSAFILDWAQLADSLRVDLLCIGTEFKVSHRKRPDYWRQLVSDIRAVYDGELTYSANWDSYEDCDLWDIVDYIGISAYFPLSDEATPTVKELQRQWQPVVKKLSRFSKKYDRPILFTEYGYMTVDGAAGKAWIIEKERSQRAVNQQAQANAYDALLSVFIDREWWAGGFLWKFFPNNQGHEGYLEKDYTPQDKLAARVIAKWYAY